MLIDVIKINPITQTIERIKMDKSMAGAAIACECDHVARMCDVGNTAGLYVNAKPTGPGPGWYVSAGIPPLRQAIVNGHGLIIGEEPGEHWTGGPEFVDIDALTRVVQWLEN